MLNFPVEGLKNKINLNQKTRLLEHLKLHSS